MSPLVRSLLRGDHRLRRLPGAGARGSGDGAAAPLCRAVWSGVWCGLALLASACGGGSPSTPTGVVTSTTSVSTTTTTAPASTTTTSVRVPTLATTKFLAFGDSMTYGQSATVASRPMDLTPVTSYPAMLERELRALYPSQDVRVTNSGKPGEWAADGQDRLRSELPVVAPGAVLLLEGVNDLGTLSVQATADTLDYMVQLCRAQGATVFLATLPPERPGGVRAGAAILAERYNEALRRVARNRGAVLVDIEAAFGTDYSLLSEDGLHPNSAGYQVMAQSFLSAIRSTLERVAATPAQ